MSRLWRFGISPLALLVTSLVWAGMPVAARAGIMVANDSGTIGTFSLSTTGSQVTIDFTGTSSVNNINGSPLASSIPATFTTPLVLDITSHTTVDGTTTIMFSTVGTASKTFTPSTADGGGSSTFSYSVTAGTGSSITPDIFGVTGPETVTTNGTPNFDFSNFLNLMTHQNITFTSTSRSNEGNGTFADLLLTPGGTASGSAAFSQIAGPGSNPSPNATGIPEPSALALLAAGLGLLSWRRWKRRYRAIA